MNTNIKTIKRIAGLAAISINDNELESFACDMDLIIGFMEQLTELDTGAAKPLEHVLPLSNVFREDMITNSDNRDELIKNASVAEAGCYKVPIVVEQI